jgi:hypothetical protein
MAFTIPSTAAIDSGDPPAETKRYGDRPARRPIGGGDERYVRSPIRTLSEIAIARSAVFTLGLYLRVSAVS